jgi:hypothetical protein
MKPLTVLGSGCVRADQESAAQTLAPPPEVRIRSGLQPSSEGSPEYFTGSARIDPIIHAEPLARARASRSNSALGQMAHPPAPRDPNSIWSPPDEMHWHGACVNYGDDAHRQTGTPRRKGRRPDGTGKPQAISVLTACRKQTNRRSRSMYSAKTAGAVPLLRAGSSPRPPTKKTTLSASVRPKSSLPVMPAK